MRFAIVNHLLVNLIGDGEAVVFTTQIGNLLQFVFGKHLAEGIVRCVHDNRFRVGGKSVSEFGSIVSEVGCASLLQRHIDRCRARDDSIRSVILIKRFKDNHLVAGVDNREERGEHPLG